MRATKVLVMGNRSSETGNPKEKSRWRRVGLQGCRNSSQDKWCVLQGYCGTMCVLEADMSNGISTSDVFLFFKEPNSVKKAVI